MDNWLAGAEERKKCAVDLVEQATDGSELAITALRVISGNPPATSEGSLSIDCRHDGCSGSIRLLMENPGIEVTDCVLLRQIAPTQE